MYIMKSGKYFSKNSKISYGIHYIYMLLLILMAILFFMIYGIFDFIVFIRVHICWFLAHLWRAFSSKYYTVIYYNLRRRPSPSPSPSRSRSPRQRLGRSESESDSAEARWRRGAPSTWRRHLEAATLRLASALALANRMNRNSQSKRYYT